MKINIVGCGLSGIVAACLLKNKHEIKIFETRNHIGGNCYDSDMYGILVHNYGPHIFHTNDDEVFNFLSQYTEWIPFKLQPKGNTKIGKISLPYSKKTISEIGKELTQNEIIDIIFKDYSEKQWGISFEKIPSTITNRIPKTIDCENPTWFEGEKYQCIPKKGYTEMFKKMIENVEVKLNCQNNEWKNEQFDLLIYTGKIDEYFNYVYGKLPYRSLDFVHKTTNKKMENFIENFNTKEQRYTRKYDHSFFSEKPCNLSVITEEYPKQCEDGDIPYYPIPWGESLEIYQKYQKLSNEEKNVIFLGRLANYKYLDMWMAVKNVLNKLRYLYE